MAPQDYTRRSFQAAAALIAVLVCVAFIPPQTICGIPLRRANILSDVLRFDDKEAADETLPELDDEFAKDVSEFDTLDALKNDIRERFTKSREEQNERAFESSAVQLAAANMTCNVPACMIDEQVDHQIEQFAYQLQSQGMKMEDYTKMIGGDLSSLRQSMRPMAEQTVRSDILLSEIARAENLEVTDEEVEEELKKLAEQYQMELDKVKAAVDTAAVKSDLMGKKAAKIITDNAVAVAPTEEKKDDAETSEKE